MKPPNQPNTLSSRSSPPKHSADPFPSCTPAWRAATSTCARPRARSTAAETPCSCGSLTKRANRQAGRARVVKTRA
eukprot:5597091-Pleurochrysis_carterae.AAC.1